MNEFDGMKVLRCQSCGDEVGRWQGTQPEYWGDQLVVRCFRCAAVEEAEAITGAPEGEDGEG